MLSFSMSNGFGADSGSFGPAPFAFTHDQVPFRSMPVYLRLVNTAKRALDYAAGGFHVSVDRGRVGGCLDDWSIHSGGTKSVACRQPRANAAATGMWADAARQYLAAFQAASAGAPLTTVKDTLMQANALADKAYADEGITPPRDPVTQTIEPPVTGRSFKDKATIVGLATSLVGLTAWGVNRNASLAESGGAMMGARRRRRK